MKVAIITMHCPLNYGAVLQAYALQNYIEYLGHTVEIIDYRPNYILAPNRLFYIGDERYKHNPILAIAYLALKFFPRIVVTQNFRAFLKKYIHLSSQIYPSLKSLNDNKFDYDVYICGSDQIWNIYLPNGKDSAYFLSFAGNKPKISYAASVSTDGNLDEETSKRFVFLLRDFKAISVREDIAVRQLSFLGRKIEHVLDPVFLLSTEQWNQNLILKSHQHMNYILIYPMGNGQSVFYHAKRLSEATGLPVYSISQSCRIPDFIKKNYNGPKVPKFVELIKNATYIVTNSFHGTAFSIIMRKNFWSCSIKNTSSRIKSLLRVVGLEERLLNDDDNVKDLTATIDYKIVADHLDSAILHSKQFIINNLQLCQKR